MFKYDILSFCCLDCCDITWLAMQEQNPFCPLGVSRRMRLLSAVQVPDQ